MWSREDAPVPFTGDIIVEPTKVVYYFDGPQIFCAKFGFIDAIFVKIEDLDDSHLFLVAITTDEIIRLVERGKLSVRGAFLQDHSWVVETGYDFRVTNCWATTKDEISESMLPKAGVSLRGGERVPDTVEQAKAYFSIAFRGASVSTGRMPFSALKTLVDDAYNATRRVLTPPPLIGTKSATFDLLVEPTIGSLIISIEKPIVRLATINKRLNMDMSKEDIDAQIEEQRALFFEKFLAVSGPNRIAPEEEDVTRELVVRFRDLMPDEDSDFASVEFSANINNEVRSVYIDVETSARIRNFIGDDRAERVTRSGKIVEINAQSSTFLLVGRMGRIVTCVATAEMLRDPRLRIGNHAEVGGAFYRRPRRDLLYVSNYTLTESR